MRTLAFCAVLFAAAPATADSFVDIAGGISIPIADDDWTDAVETSPKLALRVGALPNNIGGFLQADWTAVNTNASSSWSVPGIGSGDLSAHRFRILAGAIFRHPISNTLAFAGRGGVGVDIHYAKATGTVLGSRYEASETDAGFGFELAGGLWFRVGGIEVGGEVAFPISIHDHDGEGALDFQYTTYDIDILFAVRFLSR